MYTEPTKSTQGYYVFKRAENFIWWKAWATWRREELGLKFTPEKLQAFSQFPPETQEQADLYAEYINGIRTKIKWHKMVPQHPRPWRRWTPTEMNRLEAEEAELRAPPKLRTQAEIDAVVRNARARYKRAFRPTRPDIIRERQPIPYAESSPETLAEMRSRLAEKVGENA